MLRATQSTPLGSLDLLPGRGHSDRITVMILLTPTPIQMPTLMLIAMATEMYIREIGKFRVPSRRLRGGGAMCYSACMDDDDSL